jgi:hypothetical protein
VAHDSDALAAELATMVEADHRAAVHANSDNPSEQLAWRRLTAELVGEEAARAAWLIAQHADRQLDVQRRALHLLDQAMAAGTASPRELAFLRDRPLVNEGRDQLERLMRRWHREAGQGPAEPASQDAFVNDCEQVISVLNDAWMAKWNSG